METTISGSMRSSAGCRYIAGIFLYSAHTSTVDGPQTAAYAIFMFWYFARKGIPGFGVFVHYRL